MLRVFLKSSICQNSKIQHLIKLSIKTFTELFNQKFQSELSMEFSMKHFNLMHSVCKPQIFVFLKESKTEHSTSEQNFGYLWWLCKQIMASKIEPQVLIK